MVLNYAIYISKYDNLSILFTPLEIKKTWINLGQLFHIL